MGMTLASFHESGKIPSLNELFKSIASGFEMDLETLLRIIVAYTIVTACLVGIQSLVQYI